MTNLAVRVRPEFWCVDVPGRPVWGPADHRLPADGPVVRVAITALSVAGSPRTAGIDLEHARALADTQDELPPIIVHRATMRVIDGRHRLRAAELRRQREIPVRFFDGAEADAFVLAVRANVAHGLPLSLADRKAAAVRIIASHPHWSDRLLGSVTGLSAKTVAELRRQPAGAAPPAEARIGQDGRVRPVNSAERRRLAGALMADNPQLSLRQVARAAGISPETARAVRGRLRCGEDPVAARQRDRRPPDPIPAAARRRLPDGQPQGQPDAGPAGTPMPMPGRAAVLRHLRSDPTLRFTETGRTLLRLLDVHAMSAQQLATIAGGVPAHCRDTVAGVAMECAQVWTTFAEQLKRDTTDAT